MKYVVPQDLKSFGLIPEIIGRMPVLTYLNPLDKEALAKILVEPKNSIIKQYKKLMEMDGIELTFSQDALDVIVDKAVEYKLGARGLRSIVESIMTDAMFELPSKRVKKFESVTIPESVSYIGKCCFRDCQQLKEIILPPRLSTIHAGCFLNCTSLNRVILPKALTTIRTKAFWSCGLDYVEIPNNVISIDSKAFDEGVKVIASMSKYTDLLRDAHEYNLSHNNDDF